ncbi:MAG: VWA domain-containing protein [Ardenticatenia bacterium]|nr:VWA domain-containing protein [Ardenticatenia bacterium]
MEPWRVWFRRFAVRPVLGAAVLACAATVGLLLLPLPLAAEDDADGCRVDVQQTVNPAVILLGETIEVRLILQPRCGQSAGQPLHVVLAIDTSGSMQGQPIMQAENAARQFIEDLNLADHPSTSVGIVSFNNSAETICALTNQSKTLSGCLNKLGNARTGGTDIASGLVEAGELLKKGRKQSATRPLAAVLLLSNGTNQAGCHPVERAASDLKRDGALLGTVCVGAECDQDCMRKAASQPRFALAVTDAGQLASAFDKLRREMVDVVLEDANITQLLSPDVTLVGVGAPGEPEPRIDDDPVEGASLRWKVPLLAKAGLTLTYRVRPTRLGEQPSGLRAWTVIRRSDGGGLQADFPQRTILVLQAPLEPPTAAPSPTRTPVRPPTRVATAIPSATPAVIATANVKRVVHRAFLPRMQKPRLDDPDSGLQQAQLFPFRDRP